MMRGCPILPESLVSLSPRDSSALLMKTVRPLIFRVSESLLKFIWNSAVHSIFSMNLWLRFSAGRPSTRHWKLRGLVGDVVVADGVACFGEDGAEGLDKGVAGGLEKGVVAAGGLDEGVGEVHCRFGDMEADRSGFCDCRDGAMAVFLADGATVDG